MSSPNIKIARETRKKGIVKATKRFLVRWSDNLNNVLLLATQYTCNSEGVKLNWDKIGKHLLDPKTGRPISGGAIVQHLAKLRTQLIALGVKVPPPLKRGGRHRQTTDTAETANDASASASAAATGNQSFLAPDTRAQRQSTATYASTISNDTAVDYADGVTEEGNELSQAAHPNDDDDSGNGDDERQDSDSDYTLLLRPKVKKIKKVSNARKAVKFAKNTVKSIFKQATSGKAGKRKFGSDNGHDGEGYFDETCDYVGADAPFLPSDDSATVVNKSTRRSYATKFYMVVLDWGKAFSKRFADHETGYLYSFRKLQGLGVIGICLRCIFDYEKDTFVVERVDDEDQAADGLEHFDNVTNQLEGVTNQLENGTNQIANSGSYFDHDVEQVDAEGYDFGLDATLDALEQTTGPVELDLERALAPEVRNVHLCLELGDLIKPYLNYLQTYATNREFYRTAGDLYYRFPRPWRIEHISWVPGGIECNFIDNLYVKGISLTIVPYKAVCELKYIVAAIAAFTKCRRLEINGDLPLTVDFLHIKTLKYFNIEKFVLKSFDDLINELDTAIGIHSAAAVETARCARERVSAQELHMADVKNWYNSYPVPGMTADNLSTSGKTQPIDIPNTGRPKRIMGRKVGAKKGKAKAGHGTLPVGGDDFGDDFVVVKSPVEEFGPELHNTYVEGGMFPIEGDFVDNGFVVVGAESEHPADPNMATAEESTTVAHEGDEVSDNIDDPVPGSFEDYVDNLRDNYHWYLTK